MNFAPRRHAALALLAAALFGASTPLAKLLLGTQSPWLLAGLLYLGSGFGLALIHVFRDRVLLHRGALFHHGVASRQKIAAADAPWLIGAIVTGGIVAPLLLLWGLTGEHAASASLLLNLEGVITTAIAAWIFHEAVSRRIWLGAVIMLFAGLMLSWQSSLYFSTNALAVIAACSCWALDNNLTRRVAANDPILLAMIKGLSAGIVNTSLALLLEATLPSLANISLAMLLGFFSYGVSLVLFIYALRYLGSARTGAHFSTAPFIGAVLSLLLLHEPVGILFWPALLAMAVATWLVVSEDHSHVHTHEPLRHTHAHVHDEHHRHLHDHLHEEAHTVADASQPHTHEHEHAALTHRHAHLPDVHHRHSH